MLETARKITKLSIIPLILVAAIVVILGKIDPLLLSPHVKLWLAVVAVVYALAVALSALLFFLLPQCLEVWRDFRNTIAEFTAAPLANKLAGIAILVAAMGVILGVFSWIYQWRGAPIWSLLWASIGLSICGLLLAAAAGIVLLMSRNASPP